ncbi:MAG: 30S ribosomal protein S17, partial [Candidatus Portnoybacteria bacterium RBG_13_41_18]
VTRLKKHPKYKRQYKVTTHYKAHDEKGEYHNGDKVVMVQCRPYSKDKRWRVKGFVPAKRGNKTFTPLDGASRLSNGVLNVVAKN